MKLFKDRLKETRVNRGLTQRELAKLLNIAPSTLANYEVGKREPDFVTLCKIADFFQISIDYLLGRTDEKIGQETKPANDIDLDNIQLFPAAGTQDDKEHELKQELKDYLKEQLKDAILEMREEKKGKNK